MQIRSYWFNLIRLVGGVMKQRVYLAIFASLLIMCGNRAGGQTVEFSPMVKTSAAWPLGRFQAELAKALVSCGVQTISVDQKLGSNTADGIARLRRCKGYETSDGPDLARKLTPQLWSKLMNEPFPSIADRSRVITYNYEGTDYTRFLWNVGQPADPYAYGTWGPFGATLAQGGEIQAIIQTVIKQPGGAEKVRAAFASTAFATPAKYAWRKDYCAKNRPVSAGKRGADLLLSLPRPLTASAQRDLESEFCADDRYSLWPAAFQILGSDKDVIAAYDAKYAVQNKNVAARLASVYSKLSLPISEIDWVFFLDRGTQYTTDLVAAEAAIRALPAGASAARRRLAISRASLPPEDKEHHKQRHLRIGRDMAFVAGSASVDMSPGEVADWRYVGPLTAEAFGLSDDRTIGINPF